MRTPIQLTRSATRAARIPRERAILASMLLAPALLLGACIPHPGGQCQSDADCGYALSCQSGLCETPPPRACAPACASGLHCDDGTCALDQPPAVSWSSPADGSAASTGAVALALAISSAAPSIQASVRLAAINGAGTSALSVPLALASDGLYRGLVDASTLAERDWQLFPVIEAAGASWGGPSLRLRIDRSGPRIALSFPSPQGQSFLRTDTIEVRARIVDDGAGLDVSTPAAVAPGMPDIPGTRVAAQVWSFQIPLSAPAFSSAQGPLSLGVRAADLLNNQSVIYGSVPVTRALWSQQVSGGLPIRSSPALDAHHLFIGTDAGNVVALDRATHAVLWSRTLAGPVSASPALGAHALYAASEGGQVRALDPDTGTVLWSCADLPGDLSFLSSPAIAQVAGLGANGAVVEAIALANTGSFPLGGVSMNGGLFVLEGTTGFVTAAGNRSCFLYAPVSSGRASPAIDLDGTLYAGGDDGQVHALRIASDSSGAFSLEQLWSVGTNDDVSASPALGAGGVAFGDESGNLLWLKPDGTALSPLRHLSDKLLASPLIAFDTLLALDRGGVLSPFTSGSAAPALAPPAFAPATIPGVSNVQSTPAVGADGTLYAAAGSALYAIAPGGQILWSLPLRGAATTSSPSIACDGTLYVGDASGAVTAIATDSLGLAPGWARFHHDARNSGNAGGGACE